MADFILLNEDFSDFPIGEFPYDKNHSAMGEYHFIHYPGYYGNGMTRYATTFITVRGLPGLFLNIMENILWSRCVSVMTSHTAHSLCSLAVTDSGAIIL